jgi:mannose-1-phosphate guanylyltransferase
MTWAVVLAAGDGTRLSALTADERGNVVPKQYCSLAGGQSLLQDALRRARRVVPKERVCAIVARCHEHHWRPLLGAMPPGNLIVQPHNRGTANGVLLSVLHILQQDARARILFLPSDHFVKDEEMLAQSLRSATARLAGDGDGLTLVGIKPDAADTELGYIVPGAPMRNGSQHVTQFVEKPSVAQALDLMALGAVWNSFIFASSARSLLALMQWRVPEVVAQMTIALACRAPPQAGTRALAVLYEALPVIDFSRSIVQGSEAALRLRTAPACGWADLGTLQSITRTLQQHRVGTAPRPPASTALVRARFNLSALIAHSAIKA